MDFLTVRDFRTSPKAAWEKLADHNRVVITNNGKPIALMLGIDSATLEETLASINQAEAMRLINKIQMQSVLKGTDTMTMEEIDTEIATARAERKGYSKPE
jgi:antitoxin (DNA-binding transcriptional repressor) of toxin-antitoxin stability system